MYVEQVRPEHLVRDAGDSSLLARFFEDPGKVIVGVDGGAPRRWKDKSV